MAENYGLGEAAWAGLASGTLGLAESVGSILHWLGAEELGSSVENYWAKEREQYAAPQELQGYVWDKPELLADPDWWAYNVGSIAPTIASSMVPGMAAYKGAQALNYGTKAARLAGALGSGLSGGAMEGAGTYREAREAGLDDARLRGLGAGIGTGVLNALPVANMLRPLGGLKNLPGRMLTTGLAEGVTEAAEEPWQALMADQPIEEGLKAGANVFFPAALTGGLMGGMGSMSANPKVQKEAKDATVKFAKDVQSGKVVMPVGMMVAGEGASTADAIKLDEAKKMERKGAKRREIFDATGWWRGKDRKWRFEISDDQAEFNLGHKGAPVGEFFDQAYQGRKQIPAREAIDHPELMKAYDKTYNPDLSSEGMGLPGFIAAPFKNTNGEYSENSDFVSINRSLPKYQAKSTALHEIQHAIQQREGFARGGSPSDFYGEIKELKHDADQAIQAFNAQMSDNVKLRDKLKANRYGDGVDTAQVDARIKALADDYQDLMAKRDYWTEKYPNDIGEVAFEKYRALAGEVEARAVQARANMTPEERKAKPFWESFDVPEDQQIVRDRGGVAMSDPTGSSLGRDSSWVIKNKDTGEIIMETFDKAKVDALNTDKYEAVPILKHLQSLNESAKPTESKAPEKPVFNENEVRGVLDNAGKPQQAEAAANAARLNTTMQQLESEGITEESLRAQASGNQAPPGGGSAPGSRGLIDQLIINQPSKYGSTERILDPLVKFLNRKGEAIAGGKIDEAKRGKMTMEDIAANADVLGVDAKWLMDNVVGRKKGQTLNAEGMHAAVDFLADYSKYYGQIYQDALAKKRAGQLTPADALNFQNETELWAHIQSQVAGIKSEWGRAGSVLSNLRTPGRGDLTEIEQILNTTGGEGKVEAMLDLMESLDEGQRNRFLRDAQKPTTLEKILEVWINSLLSGPQTHVVNMTSNWLVSINDDIVRGLSSIIGKLHGGDKVTMREAIARVTATPSAANQAIRAFGKALKNPELVDSLTKLEYRKAISGKKGELVRTPGRFLTAEDMLFKEFTRIKELHALAMREHINTGESYQNILDEAMSGGRKDLNDQARLMADRATFTERGGEIVRALQRVGAKHPSIKFIIPFVRTPANIVKYALKHSIVAPMFSDMRADLKGLNGKIPRDIAMAKIAWGQGVMTVIGMLAAQGLVTGGGPDDPRRRQLLYADGWQPYSLKIGDKYYAYGRLEPLGMIFGLGADTFEIGKHATEAELNEVAALALGSFAKNITSKTWLRGVSDLLMMIQDPDRYGERYIQNFMGTVIPTGASQIAGNMDPVMRRFDTIREKIQSRIPGKSQELLPRLDLWGKPIEREGGLGPDLISPVYISTKTNDPLAAALLKLGNDTGYHPSKISNRIRGLELPPEMHNELIQTARQPAEKMLRAVVTSKVWKVLDPDAQEKIVRKIIQKTNSAARKRLIMTNPDWFIKALKAA